MSKGTNAAFHMLAKRYFFIAFEEKISRKASEIEKSVRIKSKIWQIFIATLMLVTHESKYVDASPV